MSQLSSHPFCCVDFPNTEYKTSTFGISALNGVNNHDAACAVCSVASAAVVMSEYLFVFTFSCGTNLLASLTNCGPFALQFLAASTAPTRTQDSTLAGSCTSHENLSFNLIAAHSLSSPFPPLVCCRSNYFAHAHPSTFVCVDANAEPREGSSGNVEVREEPIPGCGGGEGDLRGEHFCSLCRRRMGSMTKSTS